METSIETLLERFAPMVYRRSLAILGDREEAKDVMQDVFIKMIDADYRELAGGAVSSLLYRITTNTALNRLRDHRRHSAALERHFGGSHDANDPGAERRMMVRQLLADAEETWAQAAVHVHVEGMSQEEAAEALGVSRRTIGNWLVRFEAYAKRRLAAIAALVLVPLGLYLASQDAIRPKGRGAVELEVFRERDGEVIRVRSGDLLSPQDELRFSVRAPSDLEIMIVGVEASGARFAYHPLDGRSIHLEGGTWILLPGSVELDGSTGREEIVLIACRAPFSIDAIDATDGIDGIDPTCETTRVPIEKGPR